MHRKTKMKPSQTKKLAAQILEQQKASPLPAPRKVSTPIQNGRTSAHVMKPYQGLVLHNVPGYNRNF